MIEVLSSTTSPFTESSTIWLKFISKEAFAAEESQTIFATFQFPVSQNMPHFPNRQSLLF